MPEPTIDLAKAHDVRQLRSCARCGQIGDKRYMPKLARGRWLHGYCALQEIGVIGLARLPRDEVGKVTLNEIGAADMRALVNILSDGQ